MAHTLGQSLFRDSPTATLVLDTEGHIVDLNAAAVRTLGRSSERLVGTPVLKWVIPEDRTRGRELFSVALQGRQLDSSVRLQRGDGVNRLYTVRVTPVANGDKLEAILVFISDVSDSRGGRPDGLQLQSLLENIPGRFVATLDGKGRIRYSSGLARIHFREDATLVGTSYADLLGPSVCQEDTLEDMLQIVSSGKDWAGVQVHGRADGSAFPVKTFAVPHRELPNGRVIGVLLTGIDVGKEHEADARLEQLERFGDLGRLVEGITARLRDSVAHLQRVGDAGVGPAATNPVIADLYQRELDGLSGYLEALQAFNATHEIERDQVSIPDLVERVLEAAAEESTRLGVALERIVPTRLLDPVEADEQKVALALEALVRNALEALSVVESRTLRVEIAEVGESVLVRVCDSGPGMTDEQASRVFEPLFTTKAGHTGMGLALACNVAVAHEGRLWLDRERRGWTCFGLEIPFEAPGSRIAFQRAPLKINRNRTVLVVEDDEAVRTVLRSFLEKVGYDVREAWSGRSAVAQLTSDQRPELLITDLRMPDGNGDWFLAQLRNDFPDLLSRTLILTGDPDHERALALSGDSGCPLLRKPFDLPKILEVLDGLSAQ